MPPNNPPIRIALHVAGNDRTGVTATIARVIAEENAHLLSLGQSVLHDYLMMSAIIEVAPESDVVAKLRTAVGKLGLRLESNTLPSAEPAAGAVESLCVTLLGSLSDAASVASVSEFLAARGVNIREMRALSEGELRVLEMIVDLPLKSATVTESLAELRSDLLRLGMTLSADLAVQKDDVFRRNKRLVCMDVDSTFVKGECIDELAELVGKKAEVEAITARAMRGELDFRAALAERVLLLKGLPLERARALSDKIELTPGAANFVEKLKSLGFRVGLVSGGFTFFVDELKQRFGLDFAFSNQLEVVDGKLTGQVTGPIIDAQRKAEILKEMAELHQLRLEQTVAVGDGANDMLMLQTAGLGIAFHAKPKLQTVADMSLNHHERLDTLLYLMGYNSRELRSLA
ncbi:MAG: phosphoserine phosphatase SerB [Polyangiaceae bacterium]|nr:phosphoserine phosphatase SerB [Polyangiaceae bacterium]